MEIEKLEEENPLQNYIEAKVNRAPINFKNNVGRPRKHSEIKFSAQPESIVSLLLNKGKIIEDCNLLINKVLEKPIREKASNREELSEGYLPNIFFKYINSFYFIFLNKSFLIFRVLYNNINNNNHNNVFLSNKLYACDHLNCKYSTKFPSNLKMHKRIHTSEQLYICDECTFRSKFISSLKTHKRLHREERPYACQSCEYKCNSRSNLKKHISRRHTYENTDNYIYIN